MLPISEADIKERIVRDNPWWGDSEFESLESKFPRRIYFEPFKNLALNFDIRRATVLLGPRRVGKTFILKQLIDDAIKAGVAAKNILYISIDTPIYLGIPLEKFIGFMPSAPSKEKCVVIFDEIQYLRDWEIHLKDLVDNYPLVKFIASGSAAPGGHLKIPHPWAGQTPPPDGGGTRDDYAV